MSALYNVEEIKTSMEKEIARMESLVSAWKAVTYPTKKNGQPFARLSANIAGAKMGYKTYLPCAQENILTVTAFCKKNGYVSDDIYLYNYQHGDSPVHYFTLDEIKEAVNKNIAHHEKRIAAMRKQLETVDTVYRTFRTKIEQAVAYLEEASEKDEDSEMFYDIKDTVFSRYPYC